MCYSLSSSQGCYIGNIQVSIMGVLKGDTRSVDYGSHVLS